MSLTPELMTVRFVVVFLFMISCGIICTWLFHIMRIEINEKLPDEKKFGALFGYPGLLSKIEGLHRQFYPRSHLRKVLNGFIVLGLLCVLVMARLVR